MRNNSLIASLTGWRTEYTIEKGLKETIDWFYKPENLRNYKTNINPGTMTRKIKLINKLFSGDTDQSFPFVDLLKILDHYGFDKRVKGSHHIFFKDGIEEIINLQSKKDNNAKPYQVKQVRSLIIKYNLKIKEL